MGNDEKKIKMTEFKKKFLEDMIDIDPKYMKVIDKKFWELMVDDSNKNARQQTPRFI